jgi:CDP-glucose 4,6-dehydratase
VRTSLSGHTGFKGSWLAILLEHRGDSVAGVALDPEPGSLFDLADISQDLTADDRLDIRDAEELRSIVAQQEPELFFHLAAQPLVRESYRNPEATMSTNVTGTMNVLEAVRHSPSMRAQVIVTTDKVYRNVGKREGYVESDPLGGDDPYSASKAMADILAQSWARSFELPPMAIARAGNVIGGGDVSQDRLLPDLMRSFAAGRTARIRYPNAVRPWQHVLDCLNGYLLLSDALLVGNGAGAWNFGPPPQNVVSVGEVADIAARLWGSDASWEVDGDDHPHEAAFLTLDSTKARTELHWRDRLDVEEAIGWVVEWHKRVLAGESARAVTIEQVQRFEELGAR